MDHSPFNQLPSELQFRIAFFVSLQSPAHPKISWDLSDFRLVCRQFARLGAEVLARESSINRRSVYRGVTIDFTPRSLMVLEALTANPLLASKIVNIYLVKWRLGWIGDETEAAFLDSVTRNFGDSPFQCDEIQMRFLDRQKFFEDPKFLAHLIAVIDRLPAKPTLKWIEDHAYATPTQIKRRSRFHSVPTSPEIFWNRPKLDSFGRFVKQWTVLNSMMTSLCTIMQNVTHLHLRYNGRYDRRTGSDWDPGNYDFSMWRELMSSLKNVTCFQFPYEFVSGETSQVIFPDVFWPRLRKVYINSDSGDSLGGFWSIHA